MKGTLRLQDDGWVLESPDGIAVDSGKHPLRQDDEFIDRAADRLINAGLTSIKFNEGNVPEHAATKNTTMLANGDKPYRVVDEREQA